jgi:hypothetical protein
MNNAHTWAARLLVGLVLSTQLACADLLSVENPNVIDARLLDPVRDAETFSLSARQNFAVVYTFLAVYGAWFTGEALSAETFVEQNAFGRRDVLPNNAALLGELWSPLSIARTSNENVVRYLEAMPDADRSVHIARAHLQAGRASEAVVAADSVATGFRYDLLFADDPANRARLGNRVYFHTIQRRTLAIAPAFRSLNDPRVAVNPPQPTLRAFDGVTAFWTQAKYTGYAAPMRLASRLEADYIAAEARGTGAMLALIQTRRAAIGQSPYSGATDSSSVLLEFMDQRSREFFLEGKRMGDARRRPLAVSNLPEPGASYHKPGYDVIQNQTCFMLPEKETR